VWLPLLGRIRAASATSKASAPAPRMHRDYGKDLFCRFLDGLNVCGHLIAFDLEI